MKVCGEGRPGLVTVTFRQLSPEQIVGAAYKAGLQVLQWGGDVHVPAGDTKRAREVAALTREAGLDTICYGSYYRVGHEGEGGNPHSPKFSLRPAPSAALAFGCERGRAVRRSRMTSISGRSAKTRTASPTRRPRAVRIAFEFHDGTINDNAEAADKLLAAPPHPNVDTLWQPVVSPCSAEEPDAHPAAPCSK